MGTGTEKLCISSQGWGVLKYVSYYHMCTRWGFSEGIPQKINIKLGSQSTSSSNEEVEIIGNSCNTVSVNFIRSGTITMASLDNLSMKSGDQKLGNDTILSSSKRISSLSDDGCKVIKIFLVSSMDI